jgi:pleiotropic regulator 1
MVKCWDLEANKVIRHYHGHLSGVYSLSLHPTLDVLVTSGRDASARVWDMRTKAQIHVLAGHSATVADVKCQESDPQVITGSMDSTVRYVYFFFFAYGLLFSRWLGCGISPLEKRWSLSHTIKNL